MEDLFRNRDGRLYFRSGVTLESPALETRVDILSLVNVVYHMTELAQAVHDLALDAARLQTNESVGELEKARLKLAYCISDLRSVNAGCIVK